MELLKVSIPGSAGIGLYLSFREQRVIKVCGVRIWSFKATYFSAVVHLVGTEKPKMLSVVKHSTPIHDRVPRRSWDDPLEVFKDYEIVMICERMKATVRKLRSKPRRQVKN